MPCVRIINKNIYSVRICRESINNDVRKASTVNLITRIYMNIVT